MRFLPVLLAVLLLAPATAQIDRNLVHNVFSVDEQFAEWEAQYPEFVDRMTIGESEGGFPLHGIIVTDESVPFDEPPHTAETKWRVYLDGGHHGNEFLGVEITLYYIEQLLDLASQDDADTLELLRTTEIQMVPILNVEGNLRDTRFNLNGVDPNRNYDFGHTPCTIPVGLNCGGPEPFSESEIRANAEHVQSILPDLWLSMHTGIEVLYYPAGEPFPDGEAIDQPLWSAMEPLFEEAAGGRIDMVGGPAPAVGSAEDWGYAVLGIQSFVYEVHNDQFLPVYGEPISNLLQDQINGLAWLVNGPENWGAWVEVEERDGDLWATNHGHGPTDVAFDNGRTISLAADESKELAFGATELRWTYPILQVDTSQERTHSATFDVESKDSPLSALPALGVILGLVAFAVRRHATA